jgi:uncharacterized membrane protein YjgN (DUF898 family)
MMSFCVVPCSARVGALFVGHRDVERQQPGAVALIVIEVFIFSSGMPSNRVRMSPRWPIGTPTLPTSPRARVVAVVAGLGRQVEGDRQAGLALGQVGAVERVRLGGGGMAGIGAEQPGLVFDLFSLSVVLIGFPLAYVGHYAGLRYKLSRTRWRGIRCGMAGSAWGYGATATFLQFANAMTAYLLTPVVSVNLARPRIVNARVGTQGFAFAGRAGDIYGRYLGYYFLNIAAWIAAAVVTFMAIGGTIETLGISSDEFLKLFAHPSLHTVVVLLLVAFAAYLLFGLLILPLRCWWQAYLLRYLVTHSRAGNVLFATAISTWQMWGFLVLNYLIVLLTLGIGWPWVMHRTMKLIAGQLWIYGAPQGSEIRQRADRGPGYGEGLLDMFDVSGV